MTQTLRENEIGLLGAVMRDPSRFDELAEIVSDGDFGWHCYGWAWKAMQSLCERGMGVDTITVGDELERSDRLATFATENGQFTGRAALSYIRENGNPRNAESYAANIVDYSAKKFLDGVFAEGAMWSKNGRKAHDIIQDVAQRMAGIRTFDTKSAKHTQTLAEAVSEAYDHTDAAAKGEIEFVMTGYKDLDVLLGGMDAPGLYVVAARPGQGKTAFLVSVAKNVAEAKKRVAIFTLEMKNSQIATRLLAMQSGVSYDKQKSGKLTADEWDKFNGAVEALEDYPVILNDLPAIKPSQIRRELNRIGKVDLIIIDYIQLADADGKYDTRAQEVASVCKELKAIAKSVDVPILAAAQLSRAVELRHEKRPMLSDLKESGGIEENADVVMFVYRPDQYEKDATPNTAEIITAKHRNGKVGTVELVYRPELTRFESKARL